MLLERFGVHWVQTLIAGHEVVGLLTPTALPGRALVRLRGWEALGVVAVVADQIAPFEATFALADCAHLVVRETHDSLTLDAEEVVQLLGALLAPHILVGRVGELMAETEEGSLTVPAFDKLRLPLVELGVTTGVDTGHNLGSHVQISHYKQIINLTSHSYTGTLT